MCSTARGRAPQPVTSTQTVSDSASEPESQNVVLPPGTGGDRAPQPVANTQPVADSAADEISRADRASGDVGGHASQSLSTTVPQLLSHTRVQTPLPQRSENDYIKPSALQQRRKIGSGTEGTVELRRAVSEGDFVTVKFPRTGHNLSRGTDVAGYFYEHRHPNVLAPLFYTGTPRTPSSLAFPVQLGNLADVRRLSCGMFPRPLAKSISRGIACGLRHMHDHHIFHRDLKPQNALMGTAQRGA